MKFEFNENLMPFNKLPDDVSGTFVVKSHTGREFIFEQTSVAFPLQYDVYDISGRRVGYVRYRSERFSVELFGESVFFGSGKELEEWPDWRFVDLALLIIAAGYEKQQK